MRLIVLLLFYELDSVINILCSYEKARETVHEETSVQRGFQKYGIAPKILKETVEQISVPLAHVFNMSLLEGIVPLEWKEGNIIPLFKKGFKKQVRRLSTSQFNISNLQSFRKYNYRSYRGLSQQI